MNEGPFLFIGGPLDGQTRSIPEDRITVQAGTVGYGSVTYLKFPFTRTLFLFVEERLYRHVDGDLAKLLLNRYAAAASLTHEMFDAFEGGRLTLGPTLRKLTDTSLGLKKYLVEPERLPPTKDF